MADPNHVALLKEGPDAWNRFRAATGESPNLNEADLSGVSLIGADLRGGLMLQTNLRGANLSSADLSEAQVVEADLTDAILVRANLVKCFCVKSNFLGANLQDADLREATLHYATLTGADLSRARFDSKSDLANYGRETDRHAVGRSEHELSRSALLGSNRANCLVPRCAGTDL